MVTIPSLSVIIPNYNEKNVHILEAKIRSVLERDDRVDRFDIHVVNDFSGNGYGHSLKRGINRSHGMWILIIDADSTYNHYDIPRLIDDVIFSDMIIAERRGTITASGFVRSFGRWLIKKYICWRTGYPIRDFNSGFRLFNRFLYNDCKHLLPNKFSFTTTITLFAFHSEKRVSYIPSFYQKRIGKSNLKPLEFFNFIRSIETCLKKLTVKTKLPATI